jgi:CelD/BcsL family acetyltransferase involved in cellulose biosynthesis
VRNGDGLLVAIIPLMLERRRGLRKLLFVGTGPSGHLDMLVREGWEDGVFEVGSEVLKRVDQWHVADLQEVRPEAAIWGIFRRYRGPRVCVGQSSCPLIETKPWEELLMSVRKSLRTEARRTLRRAEADGVRSRTAEIAQAEQAAQRLVALNRDLWQGRWRQTAPGHWTWRNEAHKVAAARRMMACGLGGLSEFWRNDEVVISYLWLSGRDFFGVQLVGASQEAIKRYQWSSLYIWDALNSARSKNISHLNLLRGEEPYKLRWSTRLVSNQRLILARSVALWLPYAKYYVLRSRVQRYLGSDNAPRWVKEAHGELRVLLRHGVLRYLGLRKRP